MWNQRKRFDEMTEDWNLNMFGTQNDPKIWPTRSLFNSPLKIAPMTMWTTTDAKPVVTFWRNDKKQTFDPFGGLKCPDNRAYEAHILHSSKSISTEHVKQYWCWTKWNVLRKWPKTGIFTYFGAHNGPKIGTLRPIFYTPLKVAPMSMQNKIEVNTVETFWQNNRKPKFWSIWVPKITHKFRPLGLTFYILPEVAATGI